MVASAHCKSKIQLKIVDGARAQLLKQFFTFYAKNGNGEFSIEKKIDGFNKKNSTQTVAVFARVRWLYATDIIDCDSFRSIILFLFHANREALDAIPNHFALNSFVFVAFYLILTT